MVSFCLGIRCYYDCHVNQTSGKIVETGDIEVISIDVWVDVCPPSRWVFLMFCSSHEPSRKPLDTNMDEVRTSLRETFLDLHVYSTPPDRVCRCVLPNTGD